MESIDVKFLCRTENVLSLNTFYNRSYFQTKKLSKGNSIVEIEIKKSKKTFKKIFLHFECQSVILPCDSWTQQLFLQVPFHLFLMPTWVLKSSFWFLSIDSPMVFYIKEPYIRIHTVSTCLWKPWMYRITQDQFISPVLRPVIPCYIM